MTIDNTRPSLYLEPYSCPSIDAVPESLASSLKNSSAPFSDKLHPRKGSVRYVDPGVWETHIHFAKDHSPSVQTALRAAYASTPHESLDALCEAELSRRFPGYTLITGAKAFIRDLFPNLMRGFMGADAFFREFTKKEVAKMKTQIAYSACNRDDLLCQPTITDPSLRSLLNIGDERVLLTEHLFAKNSPMNGSSYRSKDKVVHLSQAIACSNDRHVENTCNFRHIQTAQKKSICYTGRVDSDRKALEQATYLFLNELKTTQKGISTRLDAFGNPIYRIDYVVNSMLSAPWFLKHKSAMTPFPERKFTENQMKALKKLKLQGPIAITDPNDNQRIYRVEFNPLFFSRSTNFLATLEKWLPPFFTGKSFANKLSARSRTDFFALAEKHLDTLKEAARGSNSSFKEILEQQNTRLQTTIDLLKNAPLRPEEELFLRDFLCKELHLPTVYHCKSSTDRTAIAVALSSSLEQWKELQLSMPQDLRILLKDWRFKELFASNWMAGHQITRYARGAKGTVGKTTLNNKKLGYSLPRGVAQNPLVVNLLPERYLKKYPLFKKILLTGAYLLLLPLTTPTFTVSLFASGLGRMLFRDRQAPTLSPFYKFPLILPDKVLREECPQVGQRCLIK